jgi:ribosomal protein L7/L12
METPHDVFRQVVTDSGDRIAAIRIIRERFGLNLVQAKEVMLQAEGMANSIDEFQERLADELERERGKGESLH